VTDRPGPWRIGAFNYLADLAAAKPSAADYAISVREMYDVLVEHTGDPTAVWEFIDFQLSLGQWVSRMTLPRTSPKKQQHPQGGHGRNRTVRPSVQWDRISAKHRELALKLLPRPPRRKHGRPEGARSNKAYDKRYKLYLDWNYETTLNPSLTKEQFAKKHLGITDAEYNADFDNDPDKDGPLHRKVAALVQDLKPARMKQLDGGERRALELIFPLAKASDRYLALKWREAKQSSPTLTKEDFLQEHFGWSRDRRRHPIETGMIHEYLAKLNEAEKQLTDGERE
jgi:hypothetical protein